MDNLENLKDLEDLEATEEPEELVLEVEEEFAEEPEFAEELGLEEEPEFEAEPEFAEELELEEGLEFEAEPEFAEELELEEEPEFAEYEDEAEDSGEAAEDAAEDPGIMEDMEIISEAKIRKTVPEHVKEFCTANRREISIFFAAILFRIGWYILSIHVVGMFTDPQDGFHFTDLLAAWTRWDSVHYINIAENGYEGAIEDGQHLFLVFYPLFPWMMAFLRHFIHDTRLCGILISTICYAVGCVFFDKLMRLEYGEKESKYALLAISLFPHAFFFGSVATESLFYMLGVIFLYCTRKHRWFTVAIIGFFACMTKVQGALLAFAVLFELVFSQKLWKLIKEKKWNRIFWRIIVPGLICSTMLLGIGVYLLINYVVEGDPFRFMYYQKNHWFNGYAPIWTTVHFIFDKLFREWFSPYGMALWVPECTLFFIYIISIIYAFVRKMRPMYLAYFISFFLLTYSSSFLISGARYTLSAFPMFMAAGLFISKKPETRRWNLYFSAALMMYYFISYFHWKQVL